MRTSPALRAPGTRSPTLSPARKAARRGHPEPARPPSQSSSAARTLPTRSAKVHCEARLERRPRSGLPRPQPGGAPPPQPPLALPRASRAHPGSPSPVVRAARVPPPRPAPGRRRAKFNFAGPWPLGGFGWAGSPRRDREQPPRAYLRRSFDGRRGAPWPRGVGGAGGGPGGCAARRLPTLPPPALPGEPTGRAASAPVRTRRAAFQRGRRRRSGRGAGRGAGRGREEVPAGSPAARPPPCPQAAAASRRRGRRRRRRWGQGRLNLWAPPGRRGAPSPGSLLQGLEEPRSFLSGSEGVGNPLGPRERGRPQAQRRVLEA